ncbi:MAG: prolipoprotein diacylglyceryl transferase [Micrococcales bacterium]|nr:prolipoprotein diacylglyceryl transferase [Micrococcales bacterium]
MAPLSIPSPPLDWQKFEVGTWLNSWLPIWPESWPLPIYAYAICILIGITAAVLVVNRLLTARGAEPWVILDIAVPALIVGYLSARLYHVFTHPSDYFPIDADHPFWKIFAIWEGGVAIFGGLIGGILGVALACWYTGLRFWSVLDALAPGMLIAQAFGRLGNYFNHELYGLPTTLPWGLEIESDNAAYPVGLPPGTLFTPTFLYEMIWNLIGLAGLLVLTRRFTLQWGRTAALYLIWYGAGRFWFESIRVDPSEYYLGIRANVWAAILAFVIGVILFLVQTRRHSGLEPSVYRPGKEWTPSAAVESGDRYSETDDSDDGSSPGDAEATSPVSATSGASTGS